MKARKLENPEILINLIEHATNYAPKELLEQAELDILHDYIDGDIEDWYSPLSAIVGAWTPPDPTVQEEAAKKRRHRKEYEWIQSDSFNTADRSYNEWIKSKRGDRTIRNKPTPRQTNREIDEFEDWWRSESQYMDCEGEP